LKKDFPNELTLLKNVRKESNKGSPRNRGKCLSLIRNKGEMNLKRLKMCNSKNAFKKCPSSLK